MNCDEDKLKSELEKISKEVNKDSKDATIKIEKKKSTPGKFPRKAGLPTKEPLQ